MWSKLNRAIFHLFQLSGGTDSRIRELVTDREIPSLTQKDAQFWDRDRLLFCLLCDNESAFSKGLKLVSEVKPEEIATLNVETINEHQSDDGEPSSVCCSPSEGIKVSGMLNVWRQMSLVRVAFMRNLDAAVEAMSTLDSDINCTAISLAFVGGHSELLEKLFAQRKSDWPKIKLSEIGEFRKNQPFIEKALTDRGLCVKSVDELEIGKCVDVVLKHADYDCSEGLPLELAALYGRSDAINDLIQRGAYIGTKSVPTGSILNFISPEILEKHIDQCITKHNEKELIFNFKNLISPIKDYPDGVTAIQLIANSNEFNHLLEHPLIATFLVLKWNRMRKIYFINFLYFVIYSIIAGHILCVNVDDDSFWTQDFFLEMHAASFKMYLVQNIVQLLFSSREYRTCRRYIVGVLLLFVVYISLLYLIWMIYTFKFINISGRYILCGFYSTILIFWEFLRTIGSFPIYLRMFIAITKNSIKGLQLYVILVAGFSLFFHIFLLDNISTEFGRSIMKTIVMSTGEFDFQSLKFDSLSEWIFIAFVFLVTTIFMNLLNGLAVDDIRRIQLNAELYNIKKRCRKLACYEQVFTNKNHWSRYVSLICSFIF